MFAEVIIDIKNKQLNRTFDYHIPDYMLGIIQVGSRVKVPFGPQKRTGYVLLIKESSIVAKIKDIFDVIDIRPILNQESIDLAKYIAENNFSFYATSLETMIPTALRMKYKKIVRWETDTICDELKDKFKRKKEISLSSIPKELEAKVYEEMKKGNLSLDDHIEKNCNDKYLTFVHVKENTNTPSSKKGILLMEYLNEIGEDIELKSLISDSGYSKTVIDTLIKNGFLETYTKEIQPEEDIREYEDKVVTLNERQQVVYSSVDLKKKKTYLLHGVTGSGKTEVYMRWIKDTIDSGKKALMLVPEISLTPQITAVFYARFKESIAVLHSRLTIREKYDEWKRIMNQDVKIVVGARSAIFAPLDSIGIIIVDECHESTYRQMNNPKYDAIDLAKKRSDYHNCPLILGSATPSVVDYYKATHGEYEYLSLPIRANEKPLPKAQVIDMRLELERGNKTPISNELKEKIIKCYKANEQSILFLNRRGFATFVQCRSCGEVIKCPHCDISLTYHEYRNILKCHYCGYSQMNVSNCNYCGSDKIRFVGSGTEKIKQAVEKILPEARILRLDMDTVSKMEDYESYYHSFKNHEADILIGTQMVTKGLDFESVTLVGVLNADLALHYPSFDANQVAFNLIEQVSGRAGRALKDGTVIIQSYDPEHFVIEAAKNHDYDGFYKKEILFRKATLMPPFSDVIEIEVTSKDINKAKSEANLIKERLDSVKKESIILGPTEAYIFKKKDIYHYLISLQAIEDSVLNMLQEIYPYYQDNKDVSVSIKRM